MRRLKILQKLVYEKFYVHEITAVKLSKTYFLKNANQTTAIYIAIELQVYKNIIQFCFWNIHILICLPKKICQKFSQLEIQRAPGSVIDSFFNRR